MPSLVQLDADRHAPAASTQRMMRRISRPPGLRRCRTSRRSRTSTPRSRASTRAPRPRPAVPIRPIGIALDHVVDVVVGEAREDRRLDHRRRDAVDEHAGARDVLADRLRHRDHRRLRGRVGRRHRVAFLARDRRHVDDPAVPALDHAGEDGAVAEEDPVGVDRHHAPPLLVRDVDGRERPAGDPGGADEDVDRPELRGRARDRRVDVGGHRDVARERERALRRLAVEVEGGDRGALGQEATRRRRADAARAAGDERDAAGESMIVRPRHGG